MFKVYSQFYIAYIFSEKYKKIKLNYSTPSKRGGSFS